ncbi:MAG: glucoamylase [Planctomycetota bacterium]|nr:MAG: glucoamylase [Planctomycetota bacterium]
MPLPLEDYGMIGDCQAAALVGRDGSIDWLCLPGFDSAACFTAILGEPRHGRWVLAPAEAPRAVRRRYLGDSLILETEYETATGAATVLDFMPPRSNEPDLVRMVVGREGRVAMRMELIIRFDYGSVVPWVRHIDGGIEAVAGPDTLLLHTPVELKGRDLTTVAEFTVEAGQTTPMVLMWHASHLPAPGRIDAQQALEFTQQWWRDWSSRCTYDGPWRDAVMRSLITLKALTFAPTGGIVAAPTTSLPEQLGGVRNWDYRYCWLRDATFTLYSLLVTGYTGEAAAFRDWLLRAVAGDPAGLQIMYSIAGERRLPELELPWLPGYEGSAPVRTGNAASRQFQLDVYGEVIDMLHVCRRQGLDVGPDIWRFEKALLRFLEQAWTEPDEGIWEVRGPRRCFTHSKVMAWVAFDRAVKAVECFGADGPVASWRQMRQRIHDEVCQRGYNAALRSFVQYYEGESLDASLLMIPLVGFLPSSDPRVAGTIAAIAKHLTRDGFVDRYATHPHVDGLPPGEATFLPCSFWMVDNLALQGRFDEAADMFERLLAIRNDLGLLAEEYDVHRGRLLGNFPQAFSHVGLVNSARNLAAREGPAEQRPKG